MARLTIHSDLACAGGSRLASVPRLMDGSELRLDRDHNEDGIALVAAPRERSAAGEWVDAPWLQHAVMMAVLRAELHSGAVHERRIRSIRRGVGDVGEQVVIECYPLVVDLANCGPIFELSSEGAPLFNIGYGDLTPAEWIEDVIIDFLANRLGITYYALGDVNVTSLWSYTLDAATPAKVLNQMAADLRARWALRRNGTSGYYIDFLGAGLSGGSPILFRVGRNLSALESLKEIGEAMTAAIARGAVPSGGTEAASLAESAWKLASDPLGDVVELVDPTGGPDPFMFTDQLAGAYMEKPDGAFTIVEAVTPPRYAQLADPSGLVADDLVVFRRTNTGAPLVELTHPTLIMPPPAGLGRITGIVPAPELRGERNRIQNAYARQWSSSGDDVLGALSSSSGTSATVPLSLVAGGKNGGYGDVIEPGDVLFQASTRQFTRIATGGTISSDPGRTVTVILDSAITFTLGEAFLVFRVRTDPRGWESLPTWPLTFVDLTRLGEAAITGQMSAAGNNRPWMPVDNKSSTDRIGAGWVASVSGTQTFLAVGDADDGNATVITTPAVVTRVPVMSAVATADNTALSFAPPDFLLDQEGGEVAILLPMRFNGSPTLGVGGAITPATPVRYDPSNATVWYRVGLTILAGPSGATLDPSGTLRPPSVALYDDTAAATLESFSDEARTLGAFGVAHVTLVGSHTMTQDRLLRIRIAGCKETTGTVQSPFPAVFVRWAMIHVGPDSDVPVTEYSHANRLWHAANTGLARLAGEQGPITMRVRDLSVAAGVAQDEIVLNADVRLRDETLGLDLIRSIVKSRQSLVDEEDAEVTIDAPGQELTLSIIQSQQSQPRFQGLHTPTPANDDPALYFEDIGGGELAFSMAPSDVLLRMEADGDVMPSDDTALVAVPAALSFSDREILIGG